MIVATAITSIGVFILAFWLFGVARVAASVLTTTRDAITILRDDSLDDLAREKKLQCASLQLIGSFISIFVRSALALVTSFLPIWLASLTGQVTIENVILFLSRWDVIVGATLVVIVIYVISTRVLSSG
jgi:hypothetical protein